MTGIGIGQSWQELVFVRIWSIDLDKQFRLPWRGGGWWWCVLAGVVAIGLVVGRMTVMWLMAMVVSAVTMALFVV